MFYWVCQCAGSRKGILRSGICALKQEGVSQCEYVGERKMQKEDQTAALLTNCIEKIG